jgi:hypothetical protein
MTPAPLTSILDTARADLRQLRARPEGTPADPLLADLLLDMYQLGLLIGGDPALRDSPELHAFLDEAAPELMEEHVSLLFYPGSLIREFQRTWEQDEWEQLCRRRSALQFFLDLFEDTMLAPFIHEIEIDHLDEEIRDWGNREGFLSPSEIDPRIPHSHWWWWAPAMPS